MITSIPSLEDQEAASSALRLVEDRLNSPRRTLVAISRHPYQRMPHESDLLPYISAHIYHSLVLFQLAATSYPLLVLKIHDSQDCSTSQLPKKISPPPYIRTSLHQVIAIPCCFLKPLRNELNLLFPFCHSHARSFLLPLPYFSYSS